MLSMVLEARSLEDTLGVLAERIALATSSESIAIDSYDYANGRLDRNIFTQSSWPGWQDGASRWRELLEAACVNGAKEQPGSDSWTTGASRW